MKIVICASEVLPYAKTGGLADVTGALPRALETQGQEVIVVMPRYKGIKEPIGLIGKNVKVYFIENDVYFKRDNLYGDKTGDYKDNLERFSFYCKKTLELLKEINFKPDIIHVHDWQAALIPVYLKTLYKTDLFYKDTRTVLTIHNLGYQGLFPKEQFLKLGLDVSLFSIQGLEFYGQVNILKGGLEFCDIINTVSPTYSKEIQTKRLGFGLEGVLEKRSSVVFGILNGLDYDIWNPQTDKIIAKNYSIKNLDDKFQNKLALQKICGLPQDKDIPLVGIVSRLAEQKGFDIFAEAIDHICKIDLQLVILGTGDLKYHHIMESMVKKHPKAISLFLKFDDALAHKIYAGSDMFLMPSQYEPCGLGQLIALRYGSIPLVFKTGGLADTINQENGFLFNKYNKDALGAMINQALLVFKDKKKWFKLINKAMQCDFSWGESAKKYMELYEKAKSE